MLSFLFFCFVVCIVSIKNSQFVYFFVVFATLRALVVVVVVSNAVAATVAIVVFLLLLFSFSLFQFNFIYCYTLCQVYIQKFINYAKQFQFRF